MTQQYLDACRAILREGTRKPNLTGVDTISAFAVPMRFDLRDGFPLLTTKAINWFNVVAEMLWFLSGNHKITFLRSLGIKFWDEWADADGNVPSAYGSFWRKFPVHGEEHVDPDDQGPFVRQGFNDQLGWIIETLKRDPMSRRLVLSAWAPRNAQASKLPPCHVMAVFNVQNLLPREGIFLVPDALDPKPHKQPTPEPHLCLHLTQRSCDMFLGVPYNIASYALLLSIVAKMTGLKPGIFAHTLVDAHFYCAKPDGSVLSAGTHKDAGGKDDPSLNHIPMIEEQLTRTPKPLPRLMISDHISMTTSLNDFDVGQPGNAYTTVDSILETFRLEGYDPHLPIKARVAI